jgi:hypothetical protein
MIPAHFKKVKDVINHFTTVVYQSNSNIRPIFDEVEGKMTIVLKEPCYFDMSEELALLFQVKQDILSPRGSLLDDGNNEPLNAMMRDHCYLNTEGVIDFTDKINLKYIPIKYLLIHSDFVERSMIAHEALRILKIIPISDNEQKMSTLSFIILEYHKVNTSRLRYLHFSIGSNIEDGVTFKENTPMSISLHFRRMWS